MTHDAIANSTVFFMLCILSSIVLNITLSIYYILFLQKGRFVLRYAYLGVAQLVARSVRDAEVACSSQVTQTIV